MYALRWGRNIDHRNEQCSSLPSVYKITINQSNYSHYSSILWSRDRTCRLVTSKPFASGAENGPMNSFPWCELHNTLHSKHGSECTLHISFTHNIYILFQCAMRKIFVIALYKCNKSLSLNYYYYIISTFCKLTTAKRLDLVTNLLLCQFTVSLHTKAAPTLSN